MAGEHAELGVGGEPADASDLADRVGDALGSGEAARACFRMCYMARVSARRTLCFHTARVMSTEYVIFQFKWRDEAVSI